MIMFETNWKNKKNKSHTWKEKKKSDFYLFAFNQQLGKNGRFFFLFFPCVNYKNDPGTFSQQSSRHQQRKQQFCCCLFRHQLFNLLHFRGSSGNNCRNLLVPSRVEGRSYWVLLFYSYSTSQDVLSSSCFISLVCFCCSSFVFFFLFALCNLVYQ